MERRLGLISVYEKFGLIEFCKEVSPFFDFISTGKTAALLEISNIQVKTVSSLTDFPEILDGRVKTLHPKVLGGILGTSDHSSEMDELGIQPFGLVVVNLYPFVQTVSRPHELIDAIENIDIGGVTLLRAAAKNYQEVLVICSPEDYPRVSDAVTNNEVPLELRKDLAKKAFLHTANYDVAISGYFSKEDKFPTSFVIGFGNPQELRYGENWHQEARFYLQHGMKPFYEQIHGKQVSLNNLADFYAAMGLFSEVSEPSCAIIKHTSPCGFASADDIETAFDHAFATDNLSAYGSAMGFNRKITEELGKKLNAMFVDAIIAPEYNEGALEILKRKKKLILCAFNEYKIPKLFIRLVPNGILVQPKDTHILTENDLTVVTEKAPTTQEVKDLLFAWKVVKYAKSNATVVSTGTRTLGVGMGQSSRIAAVDLALKNAGEHAKGAVMASDGFFPYRDSIDIAAEKGITAIAAPGGSKRDRQSIEAADEAGIAMVWTGIRAFLH